MKGEEDQPANFCSPPVVVVYQYIIINIMVSLRELNFFCAGSRCVRMIETHPLLHGTYLIITLPWPELWQVHIHYGIPHISAFYYCLLVGRRMESMLWGPRIGAVKTLDLWMSMPVRYHYGILPYIPVFCCHWISCTGTWGGSDELPAIVFF